MSEDGTDSLSIFSRICCLPERRGRSVAVGVEQGGPRCVQPRFSAGVRLVDGCAIASTPTNRGITMEAAQSCDPDAGDDAVKPRRGTWALCVIAALRAFRASICPAKYEALYRELGRAELAGEIAEFYALCLRAMLAMSDESEFAVDYLELAGLVASSEHQQRIVGEARAAHDRLQRNAMAPSERRWAAAFQGPAGREIWIRLLNALCCLGETTTAGQREVFDPRAA